MLGTLISHWHTAWGFINYLNEFDERKNLFRAFFMFSEFIPMYVYYKTINRFESFDGKPGNSMTKNPVNLDHILLVICVSILHLFFALQEEVLLEVVRPTDLDNFARFLVLM